MKKNIFWIVLCILLQGAVCSAGEKDPYLIQGKTMGTFYHITVVTAEKPSALQQKINERLEAVNRSMSTYDPESEISKFNRMTETGKPFAISPGFLQVMTVAAEIYKLTDGAWDGTVGPLVNLWGFGSAKREPALPAADAIAAVLPDVGFNHIEISSEGWLKKKNSAVYVDLASIAKGYGVDQIAALIAESGISDFLVEIGGEIQSSGKRPDGKPWRVGINRPKTDASLNDVYKVVDLSDMAFATSGDYRNFFVKDGVRYSHVIDPRTGYAVSNRVVSASVLAKTCTFADGLATALMVMGPEKGVKLVNGLDAVECLIIVEEKDGSLKEYPSKGFRAENAS